MLNPDSETLWDLGFHRFPKWTGSHPTAVHEQMRRIVNEYFSLQFLDANARDPEGHRGMNRREVTAWHQDDPREDGSRGKDQWLLMWANRNGTELKRPGGRIIYKCLPCHLYILDNAAWLHRTPKLSSSDLGHRYFLRGYMRKSYDEGRWPSGKLLEKC